MYHRIACRQQSRLGGYFGKMTLLHPLCHPKPIFIPLNPSPRLQPKLPSLSISISASASASSSQNPGGAKPTSKRRSRKPQTPLDRDENFPNTIPRKPRRGRRSEKVAVEDFVRDSLERTFQEIRKQGSEVFDGKEDVLKKKKAEKSSDSDDEDDEGDDGGERAEVVEEEDPEWPADAEVGWGIRASDYFEKYPIKNVVVDGVEIDWEGELDDSWVKEINCLEWESFAFHPSPLIVLVFERYNKAADNWKVLKELENAIKVYWGSKSHLPPRAVKIDLNIEKDVAYALKVRECPQVLFLRGNRILYREKAFRTADELVKMIAFFYYNAKKPSWIDDAALAPPY